jgi:hypothetical protein
MMTNNKKPGERLHHVKKKFSQERILAPNQFEQAKQKMVPVNINEPKPIPAGHVALLALEEQNKFIEAFLAKIDGRSYYIPEPDLVLIYFDRAYFLLKAIKQARIRLLDKLDTRLLNEDISNDLYSYFGCCLEFVTCLFTSIEAQGNRLIPRDFAYVDKKPKYSLSYDASQIQEFVPLGEKMKHVLPQVAGKSFEKQHPVQWSRIMNLKEVRDMIVHPKVGKGETTPHDYLYKKLLKYDFEQALFDARTYLNFYSPDGTLVQDCDCGKDL